MTVSPKLLLIGAVAAVGVLHTIVPDHWAPIALIARQRGWSKAETARASFTAGIGHVLSTLLIALVVWLAGVAVARHFGHMIDTAASIALIAFGGWIAISAWRELSGGAGHGHSHGHSHAHVFAHLGGGVHGPELQQVPTDHGDLQLSIYEAGVPPRFRLTGADADSISVETLRLDGARQIFLFANRGTYWESVDHIPEPHGFDVRINVQRSGRARAFHTAFAEHDHGHGHDHEHGDEHKHEWEPADDPLYAPLRDDVAVLARHPHVHRHGRSATHAHWHDHTSETAHALTAATEIEPPQHRHRHKTTARTALLLILGSSPMVEGIPAFFAASRFGVGLIIAMSVVFAMSTIATYVLLCVYSTAGLQRVRLGAFERYGEVLSGACIALVGVVFWVWPVL
jgi:nickel/cobalt transporter (NicO) family protein